MTDREYPDHTDGIWDDGEWISWDWINGHLYEQDLREEYPKADPRLVEVFHRIVDSSAEYKSLTGSYLQIWGELGELYAEIKFGLKRHRAHACGSDGKLGNDFVEVKTISPEKGVDHVHVKRAGNFNKLLVVKINAEFEFDARMIDRKELGKGKGRRARFSWPSAAE